MTMSSNTSRLSILAVSTLQLLTPPMHTLPTHVCRGTTVSPWTYMYNVIYIYLQQISVPLEYCVFRECSVTNTVSGMQ